MKHSLNSLSSGTQKDSNNGFLSISHHKEVLLYNISFRGAAIPPLFSNHCRVSSEA